MRIQMSFIKSDTKEICKIVKHATLTKYFHLENVVLSHFNYLYYLYYYAYCYF